MSVEIENGPGIYSLKEDGEKYFYINTKKSNFKVKEFACKDGSDEIKIDDELVEKLQIMRSYFGSPIIINSGYRTNAHNTKVGGSKNSQHLLGKAADIVVKGVTPSRVAAFARKIGFRGVGEYNGFTHVDTRNYTTSYWKS